jgi:hypothetical protein
MLKKVFRILIILIILSFTYFFGMYSQKNVKIREIVKSIYNLKNLSIGNYLAGQKAIIPQIEFIIPDSSKKILVSCRDSAVSKGILLDEYKIKVPALLVFKKDTFKIEMRLKGDYGDHWTGSKWSYRVKIIDGKRLFKMKSFSVQDPSTRLGVNEWYFQRLLKEEGLISLRHKFISIKENGSEKGVYNLEESFDKLLLENNKRKEGPILKFDESILINPMKINSQSTYSEEDIFLMARIDVFKSKKTLKSSTLNTFYNRGKLLLENLRSQKIPLSSAIDVDKAAKLFAIADITYGIHALRWKNLRFYFNPILGKLELIGYDSNCGAQLPDIHYNLWLNKTSGVYGGVYRWKDVFFKDPVFVLLYNKYLTKFSDSSYLNKFHKKIEKELSTNLSAIFKDNSTYYFDVKVFEENAKVIREKLSFVQEPKKEIPNNYFVTTKSIEPVRLNDTVLQLSIKNDSKEDIIVLGVFDSYKNKISDNGTSRLVGREIGTHSIENQYTFNLTLPVDSIKCQTKIKKNTRVHKKMKVGFKYPYTSDTLFSRIESYYVSSLINNKEAILSEDIFIVDHTNKVIEIQSGNWTFNNDIIIPKGYKLECKNKTHITLNNSASLIINGNINFNGTAKFPIVVDSKDSTGSLFICQASGESNLSYVKFNGLSVPKNNKFNLTGGVSVYESDIKIANVLFTNNNSEDALNIVLSKFEISNTIFKEIRADAFDGDFSTGSVINTTFSEIGNDALDFSGSIVFIQEIDIKGVGDKGVSAGEKSYIYGDGIYITSSELGIVSKDLSLIKLNNATLNKVSVPFAVFQKKSEFGSAQLFLNNYSSKEFLEEFLIENGSKVSVNNRSLKPSHEDVISILYGEKYGKRSIR